MGFEFLSRYIPFCVTDLAQDNVTSFVRIDAGTFTPGKITLFSIFRDEMFFCTAFFDHYRKLGVEQFLILDDHSTDGTGAFLRSQPDCVTLVSSLHFGQKIGYRFPGMSRETGRAGTALKTFIPHEFLIGEYALYADADEFLILPDSVSSLSEVFETMASTGAQAISGPLIEFFPAEFPLAEGEPFPVENFGQLLADSPYFEITPLVELDPEGFARKTGRTKSEKLFDQHGVQKRLGWLGSVRKPTSPRLKTPILRHGPDAFRVGSHGVSVPVSSTIKLPMAHFVFTANFRSKVRRAVKWKSHTGRSAKYAYYAELARKIEAAGGGMIGPETRKFHSAADLEAVGHLIWPRPE